MRGRSAASSRHKLIVLPIYVGPARRHGLDRQARAARLHPDASTRATPSSSSSCPTAPRCRAPMRSCSAPRRSCRKRPGVQDAVAFAGFSGATFTNATNAAAIFARFKPFDERVKARQLGDAIIGDLFGRMQQIEEAFIIAIPPPPVRGLGNSGGFKMQLQERTGDDVRPRARGRLRADGASRARIPNLAGVFTTFSANSPQVYLEIDRTEGAHPQRADPEHLRDAADQSRHRLRERLQLPSAASARCARRPTSASASIRTTSTGCASAPRPARSCRSAPWSKCGSVTGPDLVQRYNMYTSVPLAGERGSGRVVGHGARRDGGARPRRVCRRA